MGGGIARRLLATGVRPQVWNRSPQPARALGERGATVAATPAEAAADADVVIFSLADGEALSDVLFGPGGVLAAGPHPGTLVCAGTVAPADVVALAGRTPAVLDAGLLGNGRHAQDGELRVYLGGDPALVPPLRPVLDRLAKQVVHAGGLGAGMRLKLLMNLLMGIEMQAMAEAVALGVAGGLDRRLVLDAIGDSGFASPVMAFKARRMAADRFSDPDFRLSLMAKDLRLAVAEAAQAGVSLPATQAVSTTHRQAVEAGLGEEDCAAVVRVLAPALAARSGLSAGNNTGASR
jgi:3-hydroxyisobutyrate dehydrogenase-like beta-hydroxyacid dehydrogenase